MKKTLYSLMLNDEVVREVDILAHRLGTNRSSLINEILAEYVNFTTPEKRINDILSSIQELMEPSGNLIPFFVPHSYSMSLKSSLEYKYRPTIKYEVELNRGVEKDIGTISVLFRTQSPALIEGMTEFFRLWAKIEASDLNGAQGADYSLYEGRFIRTLARPSVDLSTNELAGAIADYIKLFDSLMKGYLTGQYDAQYVEKAYHEYKNSFGIKF